MIKVYVFIRLFAILPDAVLWLSATVKLISGYKSIFKYLVSTKVTELNQSANFEIGNRFHVILRILSPEILKNCLRVKSWKSKSNSKVSKKIAGKNENEQIKTRDTASKILENTSFAKNCFH